MLRCTPGGVRQQILQPVLAEGGSPMAPNATDGCTLMLLARIY
jgi:hypothetical protein